MRRYLDVELVPLAQRLPGAAANAHAGWRPRDDDGAGRQRRALRQEADKTGNAEYEVAA